MVLPDQLHCVVQMPDDDADYRAHMDYVRINPVKHGLVERVADWPYSSFHRLVSQGIFPLEWAGSDGADALG